GIYILRRRLRRSPPWLLGVVRELPRAGAVGSSDPEGSGRVVTRRPLEDDAPAAGRPVEVAVRRDQRPRRALDPVPPGFVGPRRRPDRNTNVRSIRVGDPQYVVTVADVAVEGDEASVGRPGGIIVEGRAVHERPGARAVGVHDPDIALTIVLRDLPYAPRIGDPPPVGRPRRRLADIDERSHGPVFDAHHHDHSRGAPDLVGDRDPRAVRRPRIVLCVKVLPLLVL